MRKIGNILRYAVLAAMMPAMLWSCVENEYLPYEEDVLFTALSRNSVKAVVTGSAYPDDVPFTVNAYFSDNSFLSSQTLMSNVEISKVGATWRNASRHYYWPLGGAVKFFAYSPISIADNAASVTADASAGTTVTDYTISAANATKDFMYAANTVAVASRVTGAPAPLTFAHALTQIVFKASLAADYENATVEITDITFENVALVGSFKQNPASWFGLAPKTSQFSVLAGAAVAVPFVDGTVVTEPATIGAPILMIPQSMASNARVRVKYKITQTTSDGTVSPSTEAVASISDAWVIGKKMTYNMQVGLTAITFTATDGVWGTTTGGEILL